MAELLAAGTTWAAELRSSVDERADICASVRHARWRSGGPRSPARWTYEVPRVHRRRRTVPLAGRIGSVLGVDVEADMLRLARQSALNAGTMNTVWMLGADDNLDALAPLIGGRPLDAVTIGNAIHLMNPPRLFRTLHRLLRPGGRVAVIANGTPSGCRTPTGRSHCATTSRGGSTWS